MGYVIVSIVAALAMSVSVYNETVSILLSFLAYSITGNLVMASAMLSDVLAHRRDD